ncbi:hypothetical protein KRE40_03595 [Elizabethkingia meningoseptica]|uniref:hypothetical protein n=1 Tax=Elizabethkingia meningoseptica TaxID=238 RepID=UPI0023B06E7C|nr:hypothetical protein [Elizabethkingia meningoseptica]MDE5507735.1 hypothetical protein [Elizabethkingia meningoseptica]
MKAVYKLNFDCGRAGELNGIFIATKKQVEKLVESGIEVYFGEVLGKHSEIYGSIEENEIQMITDESNVVEVIEKYGLENGYNPFDEQSINFDYESIGLEDDCSVLEIVDKLIEQEA